MSEYSKKSIQINDFLIEVHYNPILSKRPYLVKVFGYDDVLTSRFEQQELLKLGEHLADFLFGNSNSKEYIRNLLNKNN